MSQLTSVQYPTVGLPNSSEEPKIPATLQAIVHVLNGNIDSTNLTTAYGHQLPTVKGATRNYQINTGHSSFVGNNADTFQVTIPHGVQAPIWFDINSALTGGAQVGPWAPVYGQYQAADATNLYVEFFAQAGMLFGSVAVIPFVSTLTYFYNWIVIG